MGYWKDVDIDDVEAAQERRAGYEQMARDLAESPAVRRAYGWPPDSTIPGQAPMSPTPEEMGIEAPEWTLDLPF